MSEFGSGIVVPLVKFSEHMGDESARMVERAIKWVNAEPTEREQIITGEQSEEWKYLLVMDEAKDSPEETLSFFIKMWVYAASDHLYDLSDKAPQSLLDLQQLSFDLRHASGRVGEEEWVKVLALWSAAAMDLDEQLGVSPDWGEW